MVSAVLMRSPEETRWDGEADMTRLFYHELWERLESRKKRRGTVTQRAQREEHRVHRGMKEERKSDDECSQPDEWILFVRPRLLEEYS